MSDLMSLLSLGSAGLAAQNAGVAVASNNVANANTEGYSRERVDLESLIGPPTLGGVMSGNPTRLADALLGGRIRSAAGSLSAAKSAAAALAEVQAAVSGNGATIDETLGPLFSEITGVSASPTDGSRRAGVVSQTRTLIANLRQRSAALVSQRGLANQRIKDGSVQATQLAKQLAQTNLDISKGGLDPTLKDRRDQVATQLSRLVGGTARIDGDGQMRFVLDGGAVLVDGTHAAVMTTANDPVTGDAQVQIVAGSATRDVTKQLATGSISADVTTRDKTIANASAGLDQLAYDIATSFNGVSQANAGLDGVSGRSMFVQPTQVVGAAASLTLDPALDADPSKLALGAPGAGPGDNSGALALAALSRLPVATGGKTLADSAIELASAVGTDAATANADVTRDRIVSDHLDGLRDSISGVDIQEELTNLSKFQNASAAMTKFVATIDSMLGAFIDRV